jgi:hypothetical protein
MTLASDSHARDDEAVPSHCPSLRSPKGDSYTTLVRDAVGWEIPPMSLQSYPARTPNSMSDGLHWVNPDYATQTTTEAPTTPMIASTGSLLMPFTTLPTDTRLESSPMEVLTAMADHGPFLPPSKGISELILISSSQLVCIDLVIKSIPNAGPFSTPYYPGRTPKYHKSICMPDYHDALVGTIQRTAREVIEKMRFAFFNNVWAELGAAPRPFSSTQLS